MFWLMVSVFLVLANFNLIIFDISFSILQIRQEWIRICWWAIFWLITFNSYIILPIIQDYYASKKEGFASKLKQSVVWFVFKLFFLSMVLMTCLFYFHIQRFQMTIVPILISISYSIGLVLALVYLGYSLVELPLSLLRQKYSESSHNYCKIQLEEFREEQAKNIQLLCVEYKFIGELEQRKDLDQKQFNYLKRCQKQLLATVIEELKEVKAEPIELPKKLTLKHLKINTQNLKYLNQRFTHLKQ